MRSVIIFWIIIWGFVGCVATGLSAQTTLKISGSVTDSETGSVIPWATIQIINSGQIVSTDRMGQYRIHNLTPGQYRLIISSVGYVSDTSVTISVTEDAAAIVHASLFPKIYHLPGQLIIGEPSDHAASGQIVMNRAEIERLAPPDLGSLLDRVEGVYVENDGSANGSSRIRLRGSNPEQVLILLNGQRVSGAGGAQFDLGSIPVESIERIEIIRSGGAARFGPDAMAGVINIITQVASGIKPSKVVARASAANWSGRDGSLMLENAVTIPQVTWRALYKHHQAQSDFPFEYTDYPAEITTSGTRLNNDSKSNSFTLSSNYQSGSGRSASLNIHWSQLKRGVPGRADRQNEFASRHDDRLHLNLNILAVASEDVLVTFAAGYSDLTQTNIDTLSMPLDQYQYSYQTRSYSFSPRFRWQFHPQINMTIGAEALRDDFTHEDFLRSFLSMGKTLRTTYSVFGQTEVFCSLPDGVLFDKATVDLAARHDHTASVPESTAPAGPLRPARTESRTDELSPNLSIALTKVKPVGLTLRASIGESFLLPSLTALFWKGDVRSSGNPDLRPERSYHREVGAELEFDLGFGDLKSGTTFFFNDVTDLVVWVETGLDSFRPINLGSAELNGHEDFIRLYLFNDKLTIEYSNTVLHPINRVPGHVTYGKDLTFRPRFITRLGASVEVGPFDLRYDCRHVGRRFLKEGNEKWYPSYRQHDLQFAVEQDITRMLCARFLWRWQNMTDENYAIIALHPMPGSQHTIALTFTYQLNTGD